LSLLIPRFITSPVDIGIENKPGYAETASVEHAAGEVAGCIPRLQVLFVPAGLNLDDLRYCCAERCGGGQAARRENSEPPPIGGDGDQSRPVAPGGGMQTPSVRVVRIGVPLGLCCLVSLITSI
jgi:hypothetical protein